MLSIPKTVALVFITAGPLSAQHTWSGLDFRMNRDQVTAALKPKGQSLNKLASDANDASELGDDFQASPDFMVKSETYVLTYSFHPVLSFSKDSGLLRKVEISLEDITSPTVTSTDDEDARLRRRLTRQRVATEDIQKMLEGKYGVATSRTGHCEITSHDIAQIPSELYTCHTNWSSEGQAIRLTISLSPPDAKLLLWIEYVPVQKDL